MNPFSFSIEGPETRISSNPIIVPSTRGGKKRKPSVTSRRLHWNRQTTSDKDGRVTRGQSHQESSYSTPFSATPKGHPLLYLLGLIKCYPSIPVAKKWRRLSPPKERGRGESLPAISSVTPKQGDLFFFLCSCMCVSFLAYMVFPPKLWRRRSLARPPAKRLFCVQRRQQPGCGGRGWRELSVHIE